MNPAHNQMIDFNTQIDFERAVERLKRRASDTYMRYQQAKQDPSQTEETRNALLQAYGDALEATKTLRPDDVEAIQTILIQDV
jgi:hypothetical protein